MGLDLEYSYGQTPLEEEEKEALLIKHITTKKELDEFEQQNIEKAIEWVITRKFTIDNVLNEGFVLGLHKRMFGDVWKWAGKFRTSNKNIGVDKLFISTSLYQLNENCKYWIQNKTYEPDNIAIEYKHQIVRIHPFANGNGRHSRLMADIIIEKLLGGKIFSWGRVNLSGTSSQRTQYIDSIKLADKGNIKPLVEFARS
ncbi:MAG: mobile mystery protein B [Bacteroidales bacterium]|nr:mobile mystery protein B [Bacteroidales bacterium]